MKVFYAPHGFKKKNIWPLFFLPLFLFLIYVILSGQEILDENDKPYPTIILIIMLIFAVVISLIFIIYFISLFKKNVALRIENGQITCFENSPKYKRTLSFNTLVGFTHYHEYSMARRVDNRMIDSPYPYIIFQFKEPNCAWMFLEKSFDDVKEVIDYLQEIGVPEIPFSRSMYSKAELYIPVNFHYLPDEEASGSV